MKVERKRVFGKALSPRRTYRGAAWNGVEYNARLGNCPSDPLWVPTIPNRFGVQFARMKTYVDGLGRDFRYALRNLRKNRRFSLIAILALALGIGASTVVFSVVYNSIFEALPYRNFQRLVVFGIQNLANAGGWKARNYFFSSEFRGFREQNHVFEDMIAYEGVRLQFDDGQSIRYWPTGATEIGRAHV